jgi:Luciferase
MSRAAPLVDEIANELNTWPGIRIERRDDGAAVVVFEGTEFGLLDRDRGLVELRVSRPEHDELVEHGAAEPEHTDLVSHQVEGPSDVTEVLELFDRRYRDLRGEDEPYTSQDPA